jgi:CRISPR type III-B/RAMP module-associated protein Cmr3
MSWTDFAIVPLGPVYFGDGRPTTAGETDHGEGRFPPTPRTTQGLVRTTLLQSVAGLALGQDADRDRIASLVGPSDRLPEGWQVAGPWLARWEAEDDGGLRDVEPWLPWPRYLVEEGGQLGEVRILPLADRLATDLDAVALAPAGAARAEGYFGAARLTDLLAGILPAVAEVERPYPRFVAQESRVGLRIDLDTGVAEEGMLYTLGYRRMADGSGLVARFRGDVHPVIDTLALTRGTASLGGENRMARLLPVRSWKPAFDAALCGDHLPEEPEDGARFWLWCTTPAPVDEPWRPVLDLPPAGEARVEVLAAVVGRAEPIGGFSLATGRGEPVRSCVPAGSSWLVSVRAGTGRQRGVLLRGLHNAFALGADPTLRAMGFGHTLVSCIPVQRS